MADAIALDGLERRYGDRPALAGVSIRVAEGQTLAVFGANGAGKTTLLRILATLLRPHAGTVEVLGATLPRDAWKVRGRVGYLGHEPLVYPDLTARENLIFHARLHGVATRVPASCFTRWGSSAVRGIPFASCRGGWCSAWPPRARCCTIPRCCCSTSRAPGWTPAAAEQLEPLIGRASGRTRVLVTHDVERGLAEADVALGLRAGRPELAGGRAAAGEVRRLYS